MELKSPVFSQGRAIPSKYTCEGKDVSPPLAWTETPPGTKSLALIADDPDAPMGTWVHWVIYNLSSAKRQLAEAFPTDARLADGTIQGMNDFGRTGYGGPCPPSGTHHYNFQLFALDAMLSLPPASTAKQLKAAMKGHILVEAQYGYYRKRAVIKGLPAAVGRKHFLSASSAGSAQHRQ
jgi:Raf kinase inhibitor-like YbhB/YbcL family protein